MRKLKRDLKIDLIIQGTLLAFIFAALILSAFDKEALIFYFIGEALLGAYQVASAILYFALIRDKSRGKYVLACIIYGIALAYILQIGLSEFPWFFVTILAIIPMLMAFYYFWHCWQFYKKHEEGD
jgi:hypothetical protein